MIRNKGIIIQKVIYLVVVFVLFCASIELYFILTPIVIVRIIFPVDLHGVHKHSTRTTVRLIAGIIINLIPQQQSSIGMIFPDELSSSKK